MGRKRGFGNVRRRFNGSEEDIGMNDLDQPTSLTVVRIARCGARDLADEEEHWIFWPRALDCETHRRSVLSLVDTFT
jgi:hypothetical protein